MTIDLRVNANIDGKGDLHVLFKFSFSKPCEGEDFHAKPRQAREDTRPYVLDWVHGLGPLPLCLCCVVYVWTVRW